MRNRASPTASGSIASHPVPLARQAASCALSAAAAANAFVRPSYGSAIGATRPASSSAGP
ncbi:MAG TPA: hypothetical protein VK669_10835 [Candidatus Limnocylindrales bacterium]|nr:hypothetical protein [Candidatus Limnocylindrales bacterium]